MPARARWSLVRRRDLRQGRRSVDLPVWDAGENGVIRTASVSTLLNSARRTGCVHEDRGADGRGRRERRVLLRVSRAAWRLEQAERERSWALASARAEGVSIRALAAAGAASVRGHHAHAAAHLGPAATTPWPSPPPQQDLAADLVYQHNEQLNKEIRRPLYGRHLGRDPIIRLVCASWPSRTMNDPRLRRRVGWKPLVPANWSATSCGESASA
jgi:hypothetical protein